MISGAVAQFHGHVLAAYPAAGLTLHDGAAGMLEQARATFGERVEYAESDLTDPLPGEEPWDAIVSAFAIHHLDDVRKLELFGRVHEGLWPGGVFVNAEQVSGPTAFFDDAYERWHERAAKAKAPPTRSGEPRSSACASTVPPRSSASSAGCAMRASPTSTASGRTTASR